jgi:hypothetical protein
MKKLLLVLSVLLLGLNPVFASSFTIPIPVGDKLRFGTTTNCTGAITTTVLNVASGGGVLYYLLIHPPHNTGEFDQGFDNIKVTVDGAAERTLDMSNATEFNMIRKMTAVGAVQAAFFTLPINFKTSLVVKITTTSSSYDAWVTAVYSVK